MPISSLEFLGSDYTFRLNDEFDQVGNIEICRKYIPRNTRTPGLPGSKKQRTTKKTISKLIDGQFRFHGDTSMLYKNLHKIKPDSLISITYKLHGTSGISSKVLCKKKLNILEKPLKWMGLNIVDTQYDYIYSSRKVIKNEELNPNAQHFYKDDIWGLAHKDLEYFIQDGMTLYYEIVGYLPSGGMIQKDYDYGYPKARDYGIYIYRITHTNISGKVYEFSAKQVQDWCALNGLKAVPQLYYGYAKGLITDSGVQVKVDTDESLEVWRNRFLEYIKITFNDHDCHMCVNTVPEEGCVVRIEGLDFEAYKQKSNLFYERETKELDKGEINIEDEN
jgi:hypothetical protein